jgi:hypothetical protein
MKALYALDKELPRCVKDSVTRKQEIKETRNYISVFITQLTNIDIDLSPCDGWLSCLKLQSS